MASGTNYNIYIHGVGGKGDEKLEDKTKPSTSYDESGNERARTKTARKFISSAQKVTNFDKTNMGTLAVSAIAKAVPWVAIAVAAVKVGVSITDKSYQLYSAYTGVENGQMNWNNFKTNISNALTPFKFVGLYPQARSQLIRVQETRALSGTTYTGTSAGGKFV